MTEYSIATGGAPPPRGIQAWFRPGMIGRKSRRHNGLGMAVWYTPASGHS